MPQQTGPTSIAGKQITSQNAAKHHMTGRAPFIDGEFPKDFDDLLAQWQTDYPTDTVEAAKLVQEAANSEWILLRVQRQSDKTFAELFQKGMDAWEDGEHKRYQLTQRYLTAAERKLERNRRMIWQYRRELRAEARERREAQRCAARGSGEEGEAEPESPPKPQQKSDMPMTQTAYVSVENGRTVTDLQPPNETVLRSRGLRAEEALIKREIRFECGEIPAEYAFCVAVMDEIDGPLEEKVFRVNHTLRTFATAVEREAGLGGHVKEWPDLYEQDKQFIEEAIATKCRRDE
jgi:hypothetical protein